tara:strand:- start:22010 stop:22669 length:660 start_codon:yes stop_codon:yes gene_type:complete
MSQLPFLQWIIMGALGAASITALGIFTHTLLLISLRRSVIHKDLIQVKKMVVDASLLQRRNQVVSRPMGQVLQDLGHDWQQQFEAYLTTTNEGIQIIASVLRPVAPLLGLAGTLFGISDALAFVSTDPSLVIQGFAYAIQTTLIGIFVSVLAHVTAAWIWAPYWKRERYELFQSLSCLHKKVKQSVSKKTAAMERRLLITSHQSRQQRRNGNHVGPRRR